jgi:hypothetical protein
MKLASISAEAVATCLCCGWEQKPPMLRLVHSTRKKEEIPLSKKIELAEQSVLAHLRDAHDRLMLTKEKIDLGEEGVRLDYHGRRPEKSLEIALTRGGRKWGR